jgi:hypothetical protein
VIDIPPEHGVSLTFNVEDLIPYKDQLTILDDPFEDHEVHDTNHMPSSIQLPLPPTHTEYIDAILDEQVVFNRDDEVQHFLVCWEG